MAKEESMEKPSFFSIEDTMESGVGNAELLKDLLSPESASENPDNVEPIIKETVPEVKPPKTKPAKVKEIKGDEQKPEEGEEEEKKESPEDVIAGFLQEEKEGEEEEKEEEKEGKKKPSEQKDESQPSVFSGLAKDLYKLGIFTLDEDEEEPTVSTPEEFLEIMRAEQRKGASNELQNFIGRFGEDWQNAFDAIYVKGVNPKDYFGVYNAVVDYAKLDLTKETNQELVVRQALVAQELDPEDVDSEIERLKNYGDLEAVATKHHKAFVRKEALKLQQMEQEAEEALRQKTAIKNQYIQNVQSILQEKVKSKEFDGIPINAKLATELQDYLLVDKWKTTSGETLTDFDRAILELKRPENHAMKVKLALLLKVLEKDPTLSTIQRSGVTKKSNELFSNTVKQVSTPSAKATETKPTPWVF